MSRHHHLFLFLFLPSIMALVAWLGGCRHSEALTELAGGEGTVHVNTSDAFSLPMRNLPSKRRAHFVVGNALFKENWVPSPSSVVSRQGLGPLINAQSCSSCHFKDGRGAPPSSADEVPVGLLMRLSMPGRHAITGDVIPVPHYGDQLQNKAVLGVRAEAAFFVDYDLHERGVFADGTPYELVKPTYRFADLKFGEFPEGTLFSARVAPHLVGLGLLSAIPESDIRALEDAEDLNRDGISGRANTVWDYSAGRLALGRFGWKSNQPNLEQQNAAAFAGDMGVTSHIFAKQNCAESDRECLETHAVSGPEISQENLKKMTFYTSTLGVPARRDINDPAVLSGAGVFHQIGCAKCHVASHLTGNDPEFPENSGQRIFPYTDLLLHDMGEGLSDNRPDHEASGREWRTPPLWGIGLVKSVNGHTRFLHDGRARSIEEAILWHGGEAEKIKNKYKNLPLRKRKQMLKFLESI